MVMVCLDLGGVESALMRMTRSSEEEKVSSTRILAPVRSRVWRMTEPPLPMRAPVFDAGQRRRKRVSGVGVLKEVSIRLLSGESRPLYRDGGLWPIVATSYRGRKKVKTANVDF